MTRITVIAALLVASLVASSNATQIALYGNQAASPASTFTLSFSGQPLPSSFISNTQYVLNVDPDVNPSGSASFTSYSQNVDPLTLPDGNGGYVNTSDLFVEIVPGSSGASSYNAQTGEFTTSETYKITYTGDLTSIGLENGGFVLFDSASSGVISFDPQDNTLGTISQTWAGTYAPLGFDYTCSVYTTFPEPAAASLLGLAALVGLRRRR